MHRTSRRVATAGVLVSLAFGHAGAQSVRAASVGPHALLPAAKLTASPQGPNDELGYSVAVSGDTVVVGAPFEESGADQSAGAVYVFVKGGSGWASMTQTAKLTVSDRAAFDFFGYAVAVSGDTVVVGALDDDNGGGQNRGAAYVFVKPAGGWVDATETAKLTASDGADFDEFGSAVAVDGDTVVVGARYSDTAPGANQGAAYVFVKPAGGWVTDTETAKLTAFDASASDLVGGASVAVRGDVVVAGASSHDPTGITNAGGAYVFVKPAAGWVDATQTAKLLPLVPFGFAEFGKSVAVSSDTIAVGAWGTPVSGALSRGAAYVYVRPGAGWANMTETGTLTASDGQVTDFLGSSVGISGDTVVVGSYQNDPLGSSSQGAAYVFVKPGPGWITMTETQKLVASDGAPGDEFGLSVAIDAGTVVAGSHLSFSTNDGAAYVFAEPAPPPVGTLFHPLAPCRVIDTRGASSPLGGPALVAGADRSFTVTGACGIPATATALSVNIAVTGSTAAGNLRLHPAGTAVPTVSSINYGAGQTRSNNAIVPLSGTGGLAAFAGQASGSVHFILDVNGYFQP